MNARANTTINQQEAVRELFGRHPEDVLVAVKTCDEALSWIEEILRAAMRESDEGNEIGSRHLINAAKYLASDFGNYANCEHEAMRDHMHKQVGGPA